MHQIFSRSILLVLLALLIINCSTGQSFRRTPPKGDYEFLQAIKHFQKEETFAKGIEFLRSASELGHPEAQTHLGKLYLIGKGVEKNTDTAITLFEKASYSGHSYASLYLGQIYREKESKRQDIVKALKYYRKAAEQENSYAFEKLGDMYINGEGTAVDVDEALKWYMKGNSQASYYKVAKIYHNKSGKHYDIEKAKSFYKEAVISNVKNNFRYAFRLNEDVQRICGKKYIDNDFISKDEVQEVKKAALKNDLSALSFLALSKPDSITEDEYFDILQKAADPTILFNKESELLYFDQC